jgi:hypothetical protein
MSTLEDRLRDAFRADADLVRPESIPPGPPPRPAQNAPGRPGSRRTRVLIPLAAAAAVIAVVAGLSLAAPQRGGSRAAARSSSPPPTPLPTVQPSAPTGPPPEPTLAADASQGVPASTPAPGVPPFYVAVDVPTAGVVNYIVVRDTATGQVTGRIKSPGSTAFAGLAATAGDRTFITTVQRGDGCKGVQLYQFRLNQRGVPGSLEPLHITLPGYVPQSDGDLAITPDGRTIAYESGVCRTMGAENEVGVINLATRQARVWAVPLTHVGTAVVAVVGGNMDVSLSPDGGLLGYATTFHGAGVLPTSASAGSLFARSRHLSGTVIWAAIADDGHSLYGCSISHSRSDGPVLSIGTLSYGRISLTGGGNQVIASWPNVTGPYCYASLDPAGNYLLVQFPTVHGVDDRSRPAIVNVRTTGQPTNIWSRSVILNLRTGQLTNINATAFNVPFDVAW